MPRGTSTEVAELKKMLAHQQAITRVLVTLLKDPQLVPQPPATWTVLRSAAKTGEAPEVLQAVADMMDGEK